LYNIVTLQEKGLNLPDLSLIMLGAGSSSRFKMSAKKQWLRIKNEPLWLYATKNISDNIAFKKIIVVASQEEIKYMKLFSPNITFVVGGDTRTKSLKNALLHVETKKVLVSDVARACIPIDMLTRIVLKKNDSDIVVPYLPVSDTVVYDDATIDRDKVKLIQTPQLSSTTLLGDALQDKIDYTDDSSAIKANGGKVSYVLGDKKANKVTFEDDLTILSHLNKPSIDIFVGNGYDVHPFEDDKDMWLGGVLIEDSRGFKAHSDGDVALHALIDALLGAIGAGDIGELFPDTDDKYKNIDSKKLLQEVVLFISNVGYKIINCDITIMAQSPKLSPYKDKMRKVISNILGLEFIHVNIKATTTERLGFVGREEGVAVNATASLKYYDWKNI